MSHDLMTIVSENGQLSNAEIVNSVKRQMALVHGIYKEVLIDGEHYGITPGCGDKKSLKKSGAEKLAFVFRLTADYESTITELTKGHREYSMKCKIYNRDGIMVAMGVGCCSTMETKYRYRNAGLKCPECGKDNTVIKSKENYGGGWICYAKKGGCGAKWHDGDLEIECQERGKIECDNPSDFYNTVMKMAKKRAFTDGMLSATGASDIFTQDMDDDDYEETAPKTSEKIGSTLTDQEREIQAMQDKAAKAAAASSKPAPETAKKEPDAPKPEPAPENATATPAAASSAAKIDAVVTKSIQAAREELAKLGVADQEIAEFLGHEPTTEGDLVKLRGRYSAMKRGEAFNPAASTGQEETGF